MIGFGGVEGEGEGVGEGFVVVGLGVVVPVAETFAIGTTFGSVAIQLTSNSQLQ